MVFGKPPEKSTRIGTVDDIGFFTDRPSTAFGLRELMRNGNRYKGMGHLMMRWLADQSGADFDENTGINQQLGFSWPFWHLGIPMQQLAVPKKPGLNQMTVYARYKILSGRTVQLQPVTRRRTMLRDPPDDRVLKMVGTGAFELYEQDFELDPGPGEQITFVVRGDPDPDTDPLMAVPTYATFNSGVAEMVHWGWGAMFHQANQFNTAAPFVHDDGHYIIFTEALGRPVWMGVITGFMFQTTPPGRGVFFSPIPSPQDALGFNYHAVDYEIRKLADWRLGSIACYAKELAVT